MHWYYTEGQLTVNIDDKEHKFSLEELISSSLIYKERRKKVSTLFVGFLLLIGGLQYMGGGFPPGKDMYFYVGYLITPVLFSGILSFAYFVYLRYAKKEKSGLDSILKENLPSQ